jgi:hypothetical protein
MPRNISSNVNYELDIPPNQRNSCKLPSRQSGKKQRSSVMSSVIVGITLSSLMVSFPLLLPSPSNAFAESNGSKIVTDVKIQRMSFASHYDEPVEICGVSDYYDLSILLRNYHFVSYDDGSSRITASTYVQFIDSNQIVIASSPQTQIRTEDGVNQFNVVMNCLNNGQDKDGNNNQDLNYHFGFTVDENGYLLEIHLVYIS